MPLLHFVVAVSKVKIRRSLDVSHYSKSLLIVCNVLLPRTGIALEQHLHAQKRLVVVSDSPLKFLIFYAYVSVVAFDIRNSELVSNVVSWVVVNNLGLVRGSSDFELVWHWLHVLNLRKFFFALYFINILNLGLWVLCRSCISNLGRLGGLSDVVTFHIRRLRLHDVVFSLHFCFLLVGVNGDVKLCSLCMFWLRATF